VSTDPDHGLDRLISALTAPGQPDELTRREEARAAFRSGWPPGGNEPIIPPPRRRVPWRDRRPGSISLRLGSAAVAAVAVAGIATCAYTRALPGPAQDVAHSVLAPLGVPGRAQTKQLPAGLNPGTGAPVSSGTTSTTSAAGSGGGYRLTLSASAARVAAGTAVVFTGRVTEGGELAASTPVRLVERRAGATQWQVVATGVTGPRGRFRLVSPALTGTAVFRVITPDGSHSGPARVMVASGG
jgi:hypothetical protein